MTEECEREEDLMKEEMIAPAIAMSMHPEVESDVQGMWKVLTDNVNLMVMNLTNQVRSITEVTEAVASGDLTKKVAVDVCGEMLDLKETINGMTESLSVFADEVSRVVHKVGTEGRLGGQANVTNIGGLFDSTSPNHCCSYGELRFIHGDLTQKVTGISVSGEIFHLVNTINDMIDQLEFFASEVKKVGLRRPHGCDVGTEGKLGVQAEVGNVQNLARNHSFDVTLSLQGNVNQQDGWQFDHPSA
ncbi:hypothetical protein F5148DRAFT_1231044 [Russula earlei]|uniref:Uncharacterized protein n=1 Tax=Russula earlei TaxID=71964 RepID=A0ACC0TYV5_9AGAM|nr:hypothetical protein F5148DRAFT_1231044 [Russula earlei]